MRFFRKSAFLAILVLLLAAAQPEPLLPWLGAVLVESQTPRPADLIVVLGGDFWGSRVLTAANLAVAGYAPAVLISGRPYLSGHRWVPEGEMAILFLVQRGYPRELFRSFAHQANSTVGEIAVLVPELRRLRVRRALVVTSNYHSRRAGVLLRSLAPDFEVIVIAAPEKGFEPGAWWKTTDGRQIFFGEWVRLIWNLGVAQWPYRVRMLF